MASVKLVTSCSFSFFLYIHILAHACVCAWMWTSFQDKNWHYFIQACVENGSYTGCELPEVFLGTNLAQEQTENTLWTDAKDSKQVETLHMVFYSRWSSAMGKVSMKNKAHSILMTAAKNIVRFAATCQQFLCYTSRVISIYVWVC